MAITAYTGLPGSGKTYEVVAFVVVPAVAAGRRVVTNIAGIDPDKVRQYCMTVLKADPAKVGSVVAVETDVLCSDAAFPDLRDGAEVGSDPHSLRVSGGDLLVVDECRLVWSASHKISPVVAAFWRKHRHLTDPVSRTSCDIVVISQAITDFHKDLKAVIELSFRAKKLKSVGRPTNYTVSMWEGVKLTRALVANTQTRKYKKEIFPLYKSYSLGSGEGGSEATVDSRQNVLFGKFFVIVLPLVVVVGIGASFFLYRVFHPAGSVASASHSAPSPVATAQSLPSAPKPPVFSRTWRISGFFRVGGRRVVVLVDGSSHVRYADPSQFQWDAGFPQFGLIDGERVSPFSGSSSDSSSLPSFLPGASH
ncbi:hypothetical protein AD940_00510 [Gluconobacter thailandicus]|uniref:zonular occludens toxin domain-containing protein n=1 Tax=Gluconobacter thailandicus TaxID=257438 RepID=UPI000777F582|nr:zonular occludens toxin domain-containing protein [Gluconobacter thailandicus]KXV36144.1 hypothetical protein AD940_00510 [Gluconobacter thailandicus]